MESIHAALDVGLGLPAGIERVVLVDLGRPCGHLRVGGAIVGIPAEEHIGLIGVGHRDRRECTRGRVFEIRDVGIAERRARLADLPALAVHEHGLEGHIVGDAVGFPLCHDVYRGPALACACARERYAHRRAHGGVALEERARLAADIHVEACERVSAALGRGLERVIGRTARAVVHRYVVSFVSGLRGGFVIVNRRLTARAGDRRARRREHHRQRHDERHEPGQADPLHHRIFPLDVFASAFASVMGIYIRSC